MRKVILIYKQMGLDAVEIVMGWENAFDIKLSDAEVLKLRTARQAIDLISIKVGAFDREPGILLGLRAYHRLRQAFVRVAQVPRDRVRLDSKWRQLLSGKQSRDAWEEIFVHTGFPSAPIWRWGIGVIVMPITVQDIVIWSVAHHPRTLCNPGDQWTAHQVQSVVRAVIIVAVGVAKFNDDDDLVDLGIS